MNIFDAEDGTIPVFNMGHKFIIGDKWEIVWDSTTEFLDKSCDFSNMAYVNFRPNDKWYFMVRGGLENAYVGFDQENRWFTGALACWNPIECLRLHALAAYDSLIEAPTFNIGATWQITL